MYAQVTLNRLLRLKKALPRLVNFMADEDAADLVLSLDDVIRAYKQQVQFVILGFHDEEPQTLAYWRAYFKWNPNRHNEVSRARLKYAKGAKAMMDLPALLGGIYQQWLSRREQGVKQ